MPSFQTHMQGHTQTLRDTFAVGNGDKMRDHYATELHAGLINCGVSPADADASLKLMLVAYDARNVDLVMQEFAETVKTSSASTFLPDAGIDIASAIAGPSKSSTSVLSLITF